MKTSTVTDFGIKSDEMAKAQQGGDFQLFPVANIEPHKLNPRGEDLDIEGMIRDYLRTGFYDTNYPVMIAFDEKPTVKDGVIQGKKARQVKGHRRTRAAAEILARAAKTPNEVPAGQPDGAKDTWKQIADRLFPNGMIPAVYVHGLTELEELRRMNDHGTKEKPLTFAQSIQNALALIDKYTEQKAAAILGLQSRDLIQNAKRFRVLPKYAQEALLNGKVKPAALKKLYKAGNDDAGGARGEFAAGDSFRTTFASEKKRAEGSTDRLFFSEQELKNHIIALCVECPPLEAIFQGIRKGKEHGPQAVQAAQALAKKLGVDPAKDPTEEDTEESEEPKKKTK